MTPHERLALAFVAQHPDDAARLLERQPAADCATVLAHLPPEMAAGVFQLMGPSAASACAASLADERLAAVLEALPADAIAPAVRRIEPGRRDRLVALLPSERRRQLAAVLSYPDDSAAAIADPFVYTLPDDVAVGDAQRQLKGSPHVYYYLYIVTRQGTLAGAINVPELMAARPRQALASVMRRELVTLDALTDLATVAAHPAWRALDALPVVDGTGRLIGAIRHRTVRHLELDRGPPIVETIVRLSEMYWAGLSAILSSLTPALGTAGEEDHVT
jgi:magnesium transporter